jgi:hypothetical protein
MKTFKILILCLLSVFYFSCSQENKKGTTNTPIFADNAATIDSLQAHYQCESIEYKNWKVNADADSCLTVEFINSTRVPFSNIKDGNPHPLEEIAASIKASLANPQQYNSYYIVFVKRMMGNGEVVKSHTLGMEILSEELCGLI